jgi:NAD(P)-dependent dehydrogenase (short-subunit alcohol dehydrogenase family)
MAVTETAPKKRKTSMNGFPDPSLIVRHAPVAALDLTGKSVAVVGGTDGLGRALALLAAARGARVLVVGRTFRDQGTPGLTFLKADLSLMREAVRVGRELDPSLGAVVLTTGIMAARTREETAEGIERDLAISYLSRFTIVRELAPRLAERPAGGSVPRVFVMGFPGAGNLGDPSDLNAERAYDSMAVHMNTVAANEALVLDGARRYPGVSFFGLNPGLIKTNIRANVLGEGSFKHRAVEWMIGLMMPTAEKYAERIVPLLVASELEGRSGAMFGKKGAAILPTEGFDEPRVARFIEASEALLEGALARA